MNLLQMSISAGIFIGFCVIVRLALGNKLPPKFFLLLWAMALCKLLIPVSVPVEWSLYPQLRQWLQGLSAAPATAAPVDYTILPVKVLSPVAAWLSNPWLLLWLTVSCLLLLAFWGGYHHWSKKLSAALPLPNHPVVEAWRQKHPLKRKVAVLVSDEIATPLTYGVLRPRLVLAKRLDFANQLQMQCVLAHEWTHIRRFDALWKLLLTLAVCLHWYNPLVWLLYALTNRDLELACDQQVLMHLGPEKRADYALALIEMAERDSKLSPLYSSFSKNLIEERIVSIMKFKKTSMIGIALGCLMALSATAVFAATTTPNNETTAMKSVSIAVSNQQADMDLVELKEAEETELATYSMKILKTCTTEEYAKMLATNKADLAQQVAGGELTAAEAQTQIDSMEQTLKQLENGEIAAYLGEGENGVEYSMIVDLVPADGVSDLEFKDLAVSLSTAPAETK